MFAPETERTGQGMLPKYETERPWVQKVYAHTPQQNSVEPFGITAQSMLSRQKGTEV